MRKHLFFILFILTPFSRGESQRVLSINQQKDDLELLKSNLEKYHPGLYRYTPKDSINYFFKQAKENIQSQSLTAFYGVVTGLLNKVRCGHTRCRLPNEFYQSFDLQQRFMPFKVAFVSDRLKIEHVFDSGLTLSRGDEIRSVNGKPIDVISGIIGSHLSADGFITTGIRKQTARWFNFYYSLFVEPDVDCYMLEICANDGSVYSVQINGMPWNQLQNSTTAEPVLSLSVASDRATLTIRTFDSGSISNAGFSYNTFLEQSFAELKKRKVENLVLDLRGNGGGDDNYGATLVSYLARKPFRYFDKIEVTDAYDGYGDVVQNDGSSHMTSHKGLSLWQPQPNAFSGQVYVLIDGWSFSTCADVATVLHYNKWATFIGEETGGGYDGNTSGYTKRLELPNSKIRVSIPMWKYTTANGSLAFTGRGVVPDHIILQTSQQFMDSVDPAMEKAIALIKNQQ